MKECLEDGRVSGRWSIQKNGVLRKMEDFYGDDIVSGGLRCVRRMEELGG